MGDVVSLYAQRRKRDREQRAEMARVREEEERAQARQMVENGQLDQLPAPKKLPTPVFTEVPAPGGIPNVRTLVNSKTHGHHFRATRLGGTNMTLEVKKVFEVFIPERDDADSVRRLDDLARCVPLLIRRRRGGVVVTVPEGSEVTFYTQFPTEDSWAKRSDVSVVTFFLGADPRYRSQLTVRANGSLKLRTP